MFEPEHNIKQPFPEEIVMHASIEPTKKVNLSEFSAALPAPHRLARRSFLRSLGIGAALLVPGNALLAEMGHSRTPSDMRHGRHGQLTEGDAAILRFLAAA